MGGRESEIEIIQRDGGSAATGSFVMWLDEERMWDG